MSENGSAKRKSYSADWLVQGVLTRIGDTFDRLTGRGWKPSSTLATSGLIERMKGLLDSEAKTDESGKKFVPHNIKLKMQWDKFSTDSEEALKTLENEFLVAAVDHISDRHYYTYAPLSIEVRPDYFTSGVKLFVSFDKFVDEEHEAEINVSVPGIAQETAEPERSEEAAHECFATADFVLNGKPVRRTLQCKTGERLSVGRTKENDLPIDDISVSKFHGSLMLNIDGKMVVADTGSTNGTFVNGQRIAYGKAVELAADDQLRFGTVDVKLSCRVVETQSAGLPEPGPETADPNEYTVGEFRFSKPSVAVPAATIAAQVSEIQDADETETEIPNVTQPAIVPPNPEEPA